MLVADGISNIRDKISDSDSQEFEDKTIRNYMNDAIDLIWHQLILRNSGEVMGVINITSTPSSIPSDFQKMTCKHPLYIIGNQIIVYGSVPINGFYFKKSQHITSASLDMPFLNDSFNNIVLQVAVISILNNKEFDITQDKALLEMTIQLLKGVI